MLYAVGLPYSDENSVRLSNVWIVMGVARILR